MKYNLKVFSVAIFVITGHLAACTTQYPTAKKSETVPLLIGHARVYDGDSIFFGKVEVRLNAIDAPERDQACRDISGKFWPCGIVARDALRRLVGTREVQCAITGKDKYRRLLGTCFVGRVDLNAAMVETGYAIAYHHFSEQYAAQESRAKSLQIGIWQDASFTDPYYCRHFTADHTCYEYDYASGTGRVADLPLIGRLHVVSAPD